MVQTTSSYLIRLQSYEFVLYIFLICVCFYSLFLPVSQFHIGRLCPPWNISCHIYRHREYSYKLPIVSDCRSIVYLHRIFTPMIKSTMLHSSFMELSLIIQELKKLTNYPAEYSSKRVNKICNTNS